jgi:hypothetical protein
MKLLPQKKMMIETFTKIETTESLFGDEVAVDKAMNSIEYIGIIGVRKEEGDDRKKRIEKFSVQGAENLMKMDGRLTIIPISDWSTKDVWQYLYTEIEEWCDVDALSTIYAHSSGQSDGECNTVIHGVDAAEKAGCSHSGRFGCQGCMVQGSQDFALQNLVKHYPYMVPIKEWRDIMYEYTFCSWDKRDLYNHRDQKRLMYRLDTNHRSGMVSAGGYSLQSRIEMLRITLKKEAEVCKFENMENYIMISPEELSYIQERHFLEGDIDFNVAQIAMEYGRIAQISIEQHEMSNYIKYFVSRLPTVTASYGININGMAGDAKHTAKCFDWIPAGLFSSKHFKRFATQLALQLKEEVGDDWVKHYLSLLLPDSDLYERTRALIKSKLLIKDQYYPSMREENAIRDEHKKDKVDYLNFISQMSRDMEADAQQHGLFAEEFGLRRTPQEWFESKADTFQDLYSREFEAVKWRDDNQEDDWLENPLIPLSEKMNLLDNWY